MHSLAHSNFPFTAVAGQESLKLALILGAINPTIGGVLISGPRGSAKSTLARGLAGVMPALQGEQNVPFASLPLGTSEDRLLGALDLEQVLQDKQMVFKPGLLSQAHGGVLYLDEVNLLADHLVDQLLDVAASGVNRVERDGISHQHEARFLLVGTMNPDEGELRPQLQDRFGLMVALDNQYSLEERVQIVRLRDEYDQDPQAFCEAFKYKQKNLKASIRQARTALTQVRCSDEWRLEIAKRCQQAAVDGVRGDIVWVRAAMAHAAWRGSKQVQLEDVQAVEELVLRHRRQTPPPASPPSRRPPSSTGPQQSNQPNSENSPTTSANSPQQAGEGDWGAMAPQTQTTASAIHVPVPETSRQTQAPTQQSMAGGKNSGPHSGGYRQDKAQTGDGIDWFRSLLKQPHQWPPQDLTHKRQKTGQACLHLVLLDTSSSTLQQGRFGHAKGVILDIAKRAYLAREQITIVGFGQDNVTSLLPQVRAPKEISTLLDSLQAGGGTPFRVAIDKASQYLQQQHKVQPGLQSHTYILTDGRTQADVSDFAAGQRRLLGNSVLIDTEHAQIKRGRGAEIAQQLGAEYVLLTSILETGI